MNGPYPFARKMQALDDMLNAAPSWEGLEAMFSPARKPDNFDPGDDMKMVLAAFFNTAEGRKIVDWICDLSCRAPYPHVGSDFQSAALAAAKHEARAAVGQSLLRAIADGEELFNQRSQKNAASS